MNFFEAMKTASEIINILKLLIDAIGKLQKSNEELATKNDEVLAALKTQTEAIQVASLNTKGPENVA